MATATAAAPITTDSQPQQLPISDPSISAVDLTAPPPSSATAAVAEEASNSSSAKDEFPISDVQKKMRRAERFGVTVQLSEAEKRNTRAQRFGTAPAVQKTDATKNLEDQKRKARAERFGLGHGQPVSDDAESKKKARLARFGEAPKTNPVEEDKKKARALRFSTPSSAPISQVNGKGNDVEPKTTSAVEADAAT